jgi:hypothetical protein
MSPPPQYLLSISLFLIGLEQIPMEFTHSLRA